MAGGSAAMMKGDRGANRGPPPSAAYDGVDIGDVASALLSRAKWLAPCLALTLAAATGYFFFAPKVYVAKLSMFVDPRDPSSLGIEGARSPQNSDPALVESQIRLLTSGEVLRRVAEVELGVSRPNGPTERQMATGPQTEPVAAAAQQVSSLAEQLAFSVSAKHSEKDYIIDIEVRAPSRDQAVRRADALVSAYYDIDAQVGAAAASRQGAWLDQRIADLRARTEAAENRISSYKADQAIVISAAGELPTEQQLKDADAALVSARARRAEAASRLEQIKAAMKADPASDAVPEAVKSQEMLSLWSAYAGLARQEASLRPIVGPLHPDYIALKAQVEASKAQIQAEMRRIAATSERELAAAASAERSAEQQVKSLGASINTEGPQRNRLEELQREAGAIRATYEKALAAAENVPRDVVHAALATVVDPPSAALAPASPKLTPLLLIGVAAGLNLWVLAALLSEYRLRTLGPRLNATGKSGRVSFFPLLPRSAASPSIFHAVDLRVEAPFLLSAADGFSGSKAELRAIRRNLRVGGDYAALTQDVLECAREVAGRAALSPDRPLRIAVAGASVGAGASTLVLSLAEYAAAQGDQVLIEDRAPNRSSAMAHAEANGFSFLSPNGRRIHVLRPRGANGGAIFVSGPAPRGRRSLASGPPENVDLILIDVGLLTAPKGPEDAAGLADALILVEREGADMRAPRRLSLRSRAWGSCACIVLSPLGRDVPDGC